MNQIRLEKALFLIDQANAQDPNKETCGDREYPKELLYGQRMSECLRSLRPEATEEQQLAVRAQHLQRWKVPRESYPPTREGYLKWRTYLYGYHAEHAALLLREAGYDENTIEQVRNMIGKKGIKRNADVQLVEDVACLVFLQHYFAAFASGQDEAKVIAIVRKTWSKMSAEAHAQALRLPFPEPLQHLVGKALSQENSSADD